MRRARLLIYFLLLTVPLQGLAAVVQFKQPCPMEQAMAQMEAHAQQVDVAAGKSKGDCCLDNESAASHGQSCKPGQECHTGQLSISHAVALLTLNETSSVSVRPTNQRYAPLSLNTIWRPPLLTSL